MNTQVINRIKTVARWIEAGVLLALLWVIGRGKQSMMMEDRA